jgi:hypothetical protein
MSDTDTDECSDYGLCSGKCLNTMGSFRCLCEPGYQQHDGQCIGTYSVQAEMFGRNYIINENLVSNSDFLEFVLM